MQWLMKSMFSLTEVSGTLHKATMLWLSASTILEGRIFPPGKINIETSFQETLRKKKIIITDLLYS